MTQFTKLVSVLVSPGKSEFEKLPTKATDSQSTIDMEYKVLPLL